MANELMPQAEQGPTGAGIFAEYAKLRQAEALLDLAQAGLVRLAELGDTVTTEDVVKESGLLVAQGVDPVEMAGLLADAPQKSDLLADWVLQQLQGMAERQAQLQFVTRNVRQQIGTDALRALMVQHAENS